MTSRCALDKIVFDSTRQPESGRAQGAASNHLHAGIQCRVDPRTVRYTESAVQLGSNREEMWHVAVESSTAHVYGPCSYRARISGQEYDQFPMHNHSLVAPPFGGGRRVFCKRHLNKRELVQARPRSSVGLKVTLGAFVIPISATQLVASVGLDPVSQRATCWDFKILVRSVTVQIYVTRVLVLDKVWECVTILQYVTYNDQCLADPSKTGRP
jgi:hypothetical protein